MEPKKRKGGLKVVIYVPVHAEQKLLDQGKDPALWIRGLVKHALAKV